MLAAWSATGTSDAAIPAAATTIASTTMGGRLMPESPDPQRIQLSRRKGWRKPEGAIVVARPSRWGNPFKVTECIEAGFAADTPAARRVCVGAFRDWLNGNRWADGCGPAADKRLADYLASIPDLRGHDLACWCPLSEPCHADVLLELANAEPLTSSETAAVCGALDTPGDPEGDA